VRVECRREDGWRREAKFMWANSALATRTGQRAWQLHLTPRAALSWQAVLLAVAVQAFELLLPV
jgi:hypothetical protein